MKKALSKMLAMMLTAALLLSGCGGGTTAEKPAENGETTTAQGEEKKEESKEEAKPEEIKDLVLSGIATSEMETFDILYSQNFSELDILTQAPSSTPVQHISHTLIRWQPGQVCTREHRQ